MTLESKNATIVTTVSIVDSTGIVWGLVNSASNGLQITRNGVVDTTTANVTELIYLNRLVYQSNTAGGWWCWKGAWQGVSNPVATPTTTPPPPTPTPTRTVKPTPTPTSPPPTSTPTGTPTPTTQPSNGPGPAASSNFININFASQTGHTLYPTLFGSSMASDGGYTSTSWGATGAQNAAKTTAGFGLPDMYVRILPAGGDWSGATGSPNLSNIDRLCSYLPHIMDLSTGTFSYNAGPSINTGGPYPDPNTFGNQCVQVAQRFVANGMPCRMWEIGNEWDGHVSNSQYFALFSAAAKALKAYDPSYKVMGANYSYSSAMNWQSFAASCGSQLDMVTWHNYDVGSGDSDSGAMSKCISRFQGDSSGVRSALAGTINATTPACIAEYNMDGGPPGDPRQSLIQGAVYNILGLYTAFKTDPLTTHGSIWDWLGDGYYGLVIDPYNNPGNHPAYSVVPCGYALKYCRQFMGGNVVATTGPSGSIAYLATTNGTNFGTLIINYGSQSFAGPIALSHWPVNSTGNGTVNAYTISSANPTGAVTTLPVSSGITSSITIPAMSVTVLTSR